MKHCPHCGKSLRKTSLTQREHEQYRRDVTHAAEAIIPLLPKKLDRLVEELKMQFDERAIRFGFYGLIGTGVIRQDENGIGIKV